VIAAGGSCSDVTNHVTFSALLLKLTAVNLGVIVTVHVTHTHTHAGMPVYATHR